MPLLKALPQDIGRVKRKNEGAGKFSAPLSICRVEIQILSFGLAPLVPYQTY